MAISKSKHIKRPLGRGLNAIFSSEATQTIHTAEDEGAEKILGGIVEIPISDIFANPTQPRTSFDEKALLELSESIKSLGIIQPITVRKVEQKFEIISGERRWRASKMAGLDCIPAYVRIINDQELLEMALVENIQREDLDPIEVALTYERLLGEVGLTQEQLSQRLGKERSTITNSIRLLRLSPEIQRQIREKNISAGHGRAILSLENPELQKELFDLIKRSGLSVRQAEAWANAHKEPKPQTPQKKREYPNHIKRALHTIESVLDVPIEVKTSRNGDKGKIILDFASHEDLEKILSLFRQ